MMKVWRAIARWLTHLFCKRMRKKISLYIGERLVDLDTSSLILFNYTMEDLSNPTIVKNSYSQQVTLKGTTNNNAIFGDYFRLDRNLSMIGDNTGVSFNPSQKTPFTIYADDGRILESGYVKLDDIIRNGSSIEYKVTLYGGLGSFLYSLSYNESGDKMTLADLDYLTGGEGELDFTINATTVRNAWRNITEHLEPGDSGYDAKWGVINFAPCYNGVPSGDFDAKKAVFVPSQVGLLDSQSGGYQLKNGYSIVTMPEAHDEWAVKDFRSYLQRPVVSMSAFLEAITKATNNGGYEVDKSILDSSSAFPYPKMWMTLPMLPSLGGLKQTTSGLSGTFSPTTASTLNKVGTYTITGGSGFGSKLTATFKARFRTIVNSSAAALFMSGGDRISNVVLQAVAYNSNNEIVGGSDVLVLGSDVSTNVRNTCESFGYSPLFEDGDTQFLHVTGGNSFTRVSTNMYEYPLDLNFSLSGYSIAKIEIVASSFLRQRQTIQSKSGVRTIYTLLNGGRPAPYSLWPTSGTSSVTPSGATLVGQAITLSGTSSSSLRSNALITKQMLLSSTKTPAECLLSFCKIFGLSLLYDAPTKKVTIVRRNDLYQDETIDLTKRIDKSKAISVKPMVFDSKWYDFKLEGAGGAYYDEYLKSMGREYGIQRVNTGYDFNSEARNLMDGNAFKNACTTLKRGRFFNWIIQGSKPYPSVFLDPGNKYTLYTSASQSKEFEISVPTSSATVNELNEYGHSGYDVEFARKLDLADASGKGVSGENILVFFEGTSNYPYFHVTDDISAMDTLNSGKPCWILSPGTEDGVDIPVFQRYTYKGGGWTIDSSLDFGIPYELDIPGITYKEGVTIYDLAWRKYMADRYDVNTKVMTCRVNLAGLQVDGGLLRKFYWFENTLWSLNKITNYSLTTDDTVECEFVQVQNKDNYLNGQYNG